MWYAEILRSGHSFNIAIYIKYSFTTWALAVESKVYFSEISGCCLASMLTDFINGISLWFVLILIVLILIEINWYSWMICSLTILPTTLPLPRLYYVASTVLNRSWTVSANKESSRTSSLVTMGFSLKTFSVPPGLIPVWRSRQGAGRLNFES